MEHQKQNSNMIQNSHYLASLKSSFKKLKHMIDNELRLKKVIQKSQKIDFLSSSLPDDKLNMKNSLYINLFLLFNSLTIGFFMLSKNDYRKFKYFSIYMISLAYFGFTIGILWQDQSFLQKLSTRQDAYKNQMKYLFRKQCLSSIELNRIQHKRQLFKNLNSQFQAFHTISLNQKAINFLS